ncbi:MAG: terminase small subunit [Lentihominibacter sp.]
MATQLTKMQEEFVQNLINGASQREAYKKAYNAENMKESTIDSKASRLFKNQKVRARYDEIQERMRERQETKTILTTEERMEWLTKVVSGEIKEEHILKEGKNYVQVMKPVRVDTKLKALDLLNKMDGNYKTNIEGSLDINKKLEDLI